MPQLVNPWKCTLLRRIHVQSWGYRLDSGETYLFEVYGSIEYSYLTGGNNREIDRVSREISSVHPNATHNWYIRMYFRNCYSTDLPDVVCMLLSKSQATGHDPANCWEVLSCSCQKCSMNCIATPYGELFFFSKNSGIHEFHLGRRIS